MSEGYTLKIAQTKPEIEQIRQYSDRVYQKDGVTLSGMDNTDLMPDTKIFYATKEDKNDSEECICGTIRYSFDSKKGLPFEKAVFMRAYTPGTNVKDWYPIEGTKHNIDIGSLREDNSFNAGLVNYGMLAIDTKHRTAAHIYEILMKLCVVHSINNGAKKAIITVNYAIEKTMERFGFKRFCNERLYAPEIGNYIVAMTADLTSSFFSHIDLKLPENVSIFTGSQIFRVYPRDTTICKQNDPNDQKVFLVVSGSVRIEVASSSDRKRIALIGPGEIFGEMALIDNQPRSADVICNHRHVILQELTNLNKNIISRTPEIFFEFASMLSRRIRVLNEKVKQSDSFTPEKYSSLPMPESLVEFISQQDSQFFSKSERICRQGDESNGMYLINKGKIAISIELSDGSELLLGFAQTGSLVGEMALIEGKRRSATMTACDIVSAIEIKKEDLTQLIRSDWRVGHFMLRTIVQKLRLTDKIIAGSTLIRQDLETDLKQKLLSISGHEKFILAIHEAFDNLDPNQEKTIYDIHWICDELGISQTKIKPWLKQLQKHRAIKICRETGSITVLDETIIEQQELIYDLTA